MGKLKLYKIKFWADEKYGIEAWSNGCEFTRTVSGRNYEKAIKKALKKEFHSKIVNDPKNKKNHEKPVKYRNIDIISLEMIGEED